MYWLRSWGPLLIPATIALLVAVGWPTPGRADHPRFFLPAPAGTGWSIVSGYNTPNHTGSDPYAIDLVRVDAPTAGTPVLAPVAGTVTWVSDSCVTLGDSHGMAVLICHLYPSAGLQAGGEVIVGQRIGEVAPAGLAGNNGLAHLHLAVHHTWGAGELQATVPFSGAYALEGRELPPTDASNAYAGETFLSTNRTAPSSVATEDPDEGNLSPEPSDGSDQASDTSPTGDSTADEAALTDPVYLHPGWNLIGWRGSGAIEAALAPIAGSIAAVFAYDEGAQAFRRYAPDAPPSLNTLTTLQPGDGLFIQVTAPTGVHWALPPVGAPQTIAIAAGFNLVAWTGDHRPVAEAVTGIADVLLGVYAFDAAAQRYREYRPDGPAFLSDLQTLEPGQAIWVQARAPALWEAVTTDLQPGAQIRARVLGPGCLNIRPGPTTVDAPPLACLAEGTAVELTGETALDANGDEWLYVHARGYTGWVFAAFIAEFAVGPVVDGVATFYHPSLDGDPLFCGGTYDRLDPTIAAATSWPCGTHLRVWRGDRFVDVTVQDSGLLPPNHLDLSEAAFQRIGDLAEGWLAVRIEVLGDRGGE